MPIPPSINTALKSVDCDMRELYRIFSRNASDMIMQRKGLTSYLGVKKSLAVVCFLFAALFDGIMMSDSEHSDSDP